MKNPPDEFHSRSQEKRIRTLRGEPLDAALAEGDAAHSDTRCQNCGCRRWEHMQHAIQQVWRDGDQQRCVCGSCPAWEAAAVERAALPPQLASEKKQPWDDGPAPCTNCGDPSKPHPAYADFVGPFCEGCWERLNEFFAAPLKAIRDDYPDLALVVPTFCARLDAFLGAIAVGAALPPTPAPQWQPIENPPEIGALVIVALIRDGKVWRLSDAKRGELGYYTINGGIQCHWRTHWMPMPRVAEASALARPVEHGRTCPKVAHTGSGYLHGPDDDRPYDVDGVAYCGRCHMALEASALARPRAEDATASAPSHSAPLPPVPSD